MRFLPNEAAEQSAPAMPYLQNRGAYDAAVELIARHGDEAGFEAAARAEYSRNQGNLQHFCHWRQIERLIVLLATDRCFGRLH